MAKLIEALEDDDDVRSVTSNFEASDEDLEAFKLKILSCKDNYGKHFTAT